MLTEVIHSSFIQTISIVPLQVHFYSEVRPTHHGYCAGISHWIKNLPKVPAWRLERESNPPWPSGWKLSTQPMRHHLPHVRMLYRNANWNVRMLNSNVDRRNPLQKINFLCQMRSNLLTCSHLSGLGLNSVATVLCRLTLVEWRKKIRLIYWR